VIILFFTILGFAVALYGVFMEQQIKKNSDHKPICDISDRISCSKVLKSSYANMFGVSNAIIGLIYYASLFVLQLLSWYTFLLILAILGALFSLYLAFILYTRIKTFCILCTSAYIINFILVYFAYIQYLG